jgi:hypothetical protein
MISDACTQILLIAMIFAKLNAKIVDGETALLHGG